METVTAWGYNVKISDAIALMAVIIAAGALWVSWLAFRFNRNSVALYEGSDQQGMVLYITNNSPHLVTVLDLATSGQMGIVAHWWARKD